MTSIDITRNKIIDKLLAITNKSYLDAFYTLIEESTIVKNKIELSEAQITMLKMSENDFENGKIISNEQLEKDEEEWLKNQ